MPVPTRTYGGSARFPPDRLVWQTGPLLSCHATPATGGTLAAWDAFIFKTNRGDLWHWRGYLMSKIIDALDQASLRDDVPAFRPGDTVKVHVKVVEGNRSRIQVFAGVVISRAGDGVREAFTVRKVSFGVGVERTFPVHSPIIDKIEVDRRGDVRRAKLYYLRESARQGGQDQGEARRQLSRGLRRWLIGGSRPLPDERAPPPTSPLTQTLESSRSILSELDLRPARRGLLQGADGRRGRRGDRGVAAPRFRRADVPDPVDLDGEHLADRRPGGGREAHRHRARPSRGLQGPRRLADRHAVGRNAGRSARPSSSSACCPTPAPST